MANAQGLQGGRGHQCPVLSGFDLLCQPARIGQVSPQPRLQAADALLAYQEPQLQGAETAAQGDPPVTVVSHLAVCAGLQVTRVGGHDANQMLGVAHEVHRAIEGRAQPFVRVEH